MSGAKKIGNKILGGVLNVFGQPPAPPEQVQQVAEPVMEDREDRNASEIDRLRRKRNQPSLFNLLRSSDNPTIL